jgi:O-antigen/teichoic acid export membrane protein
MNTRSKTLSNTVFSSVSIYVEYFLGLFTSIFIARYMGPSEFGIYGLVIWLAGLGISLINGGFPSGTIKFAAEFRGAGRVELTGALVVLIRRMQRVAMVVVVSISTLLFFTIGRQYVPEINKVMFALLMISIVLRAPYMLNISIAKGFEDFRSNAVVASIGASVNLVLIIGAILLHAPMEGFIAVYTLTGLAFFAVSTWQIRDLVPAAPPDTAIPPDTLSRIYRYLSLVIFTMIVSFLSASGVEVLFLNLWATSAEAGYFRAAFQLSSAAALLVPGAFAATMLPMMARSIGQSVEMAGRRFVASTIYLVLLAAPLTAFGFVFAPQIVHVLYGPAYAPAAPALAWCLAACSFISLSAGASSFLISADRQATTLALMVVNGTIKITVGAYLTMRFGLTGAIASFVLVTLVNNCSQFWLAIRHSGARLPWLDFARVVLAAAVSTLPALAAAHYLPAWPALIVGSILLAITYALATLAFGCWDRHDIDYIGDLAKKLTRGRAHPFERLLGWARTRARVAEPL